jgi:nitrogen fixation protein NifU and related proteins
MTVALGCKQAIRCGVCRSGIQLIVRAFELVLQHIEARGKYNRKVYSVALLDHFQNPRNAGEVQAPDAVARLENPACGDILELMLKLEGKRIVDIRFRAQGCVPTMACGSAITELAKGKTVDDAQRISKEDLLEKVGGVPGASYHTCQLAIDTLQSLLRGL